ncbi:PREDICTED: sex peptide receptor-like, partial [Rhagoletis zephyria]|uniref:sex peptide receptor-like n=1 Tax=Rhagoletis zephyria TaxID=28612 RepID=UPI000811613D
MTAAQLAQQHNTTHASLVTDTEVAATIMAPIQQTGNFNSTFTTAFYSSGVTPTSTSIPTTAIAAFYPRDDVGGSSGDDALEWSDSPATIAGSYSGLSAAMLAAIDSTNDYNDTQLFDQNSSDYYDYLPPCESFDIVSNWSYWNVTCDNALEYGMPLYGYCMPFLLIITVAANSLIVLVLSKKHLATPTNFVLMAMAICDMLTVIFPAPGLWYMYTFGNHYKPLHPVSMCLAYSIFNE